MTAFAEQVYKLLKQVPQGKVTTYKALAEAAGCKAYRAIGQMMRNNPYAPTVPCHRVVASNGTLGGFMGKKMGDAIKKKIALLTAEGVQIVEGKIQNFDKVLHDFKS